MSRYHLAQINIARALKPLNDPLLADFMVQIAPVNALADTAPGFVWRLQSEYGVGATEIQAFDDKYILINMSVWESVEALHEFTYKGMHLGVFRDRRKWFEALDKPILAMWWIPAGHVPTVEEGKEKLELLQKLGPTAEAFHFRAPFPSPDQTGLAAGG